MSNFIIFNIGFIVISIIYISIEPRIKSNERKYIIGAMLLMFSVMMAFRPAETKDTFGYIQGFDKISTDQFYGTNFLRKYEGYELGYIFLIQIFKRVFDNYHLFFFLISLIGSSLTIIGLKKLSDRIIPSAKEKYAVIWASYVSYFALLYNGISVRAGLAMALCIVAINFMLEGKKIKGIALFCLACTIQRMSILLVVGYGIINYFPVFKKRIYFIIWLALGVIMFSGISEILMRYICDLLEQFFVKYQINGYSGFLNNLDLEIGTADIYLWAICGFFILYCHKNVYYSKYLNVVLVGEMIITFMYGVRAIARAYDMFFLFMIPIINFIYYENHKQMFTVKRYIILCILVVNSVLMLRLCF